MSSVLESTDAKNKLEDLSGVKLKPGENPYDALIDTCNDDHVECTLSYMQWGLSGADMVGEVRNTQQKEKFLALDFKELVIDPYLLRLENPHLEPGFKDPRHCMTFWGRPPIHILKLAGEIQTRLKAVAPAVWLMPLYQMHITVLELAYSRTAEEIEAIKNSLAPALPAVAHYTYRHRARLVKPMVSHDLSAFALSFLPASGEPAVSSHSDNTTEVVQKQGDPYTYHHVRRDVWNIAKETAGTTAVDSRYIVPSAHVTLGRFLTNDDHATPEQRKAWVDAIEDINRWLETEIWDRSDADFVGEWVLGQEKGLDVRVGTLWYGGGRTVLLGEGF